ncbi:glycosyltransferase family 25 protein [Ochrobactrum sp. GRS2]|nr:glycosyltransferase family 25 protein [Ochrobactrum sp. GRS2]
MVRTYLINLDGSQERLDISRGQLERAGIEFTRVPAVDGRKGDPRAHPAYHEKRALAFMGCQVSGGELGCYLSHLKAAQMFLDSGEKYAMVLEDDMSVPADLAKMAEELLSWLEKDGRYWDLINIGTDGIKRHTPLCTLQGQDQRRNLTSAHYFPMTTGGLIWSRAGAQNFVNSQHEIFAPVDNYLRFWLTRTNTGLAVWPPLVKARGAQSDIDALGTGSRTAASVEKHFFYNLIRQRWFVLNKLRSYRHLWTARLKRRLSGNSALPVADQIVLPPKISPAE